MISSLLNLQADKLHAPEAKAVFEECRDRIHSMARLHRQLYVRGNFAGIEFSAYLRELAETLIAGHTPPGSDVQLNLHTEPVEVGLDTAVPLSLIINELILNSLKHGFVGKRSGTLTIEMRANGPQAVLVVRDDGAGFPESFDPKKGTGLGLQLVLGLTHQIRGTVEFENGPGATTTVHFPASESRERS